MAEGPVIRQPVVLNDILRNAQATGPATAASFQGPMLLNDSFTVAVDTTNVWATSLGGTGTFARQVVSGRPLARLDCPAGADKALCYSLKPFQPPGAASTTQDIYQRVTMEWLMAFTSVANIDNTQMVAGLNAIGAERSDINVACFCLASDALNTVTDAAGAETVTVVGGDAITLTNFNRYKIVMRNGTVEFWVNNTLRNTHTANILAVATQATIGLRSEAAVTARLEFTDIRCWLSDT